MALRKRGELEAREAVDVARMAKKSAGSLIYTLLIVVALVMLVVTSVNFRTSWDFSVTTANSLSPMSLEILEGLENDVHLYAIISGQEESRRENYWDLLTLFRSESDHVKVEFVDPIRSPGRLAELGVDTAEHDMGRGGMTLVISGEDRFTFRGVSEEDITNAIHEVDRTTKRVVGILRGYGERDPRATSGAGFARGAEALRREYYEVRDVRASEGIPDDVTVLLLVGPRLTIPAKDLDAIGEWLDEGDGRLMVMVDPEHESGANELLLPWGLQVLPGQILDKVENISNSSAFLRISEYSDHPVVKAFGRRYPAALAIASPVDHFETGEGALFHQELAGSSRHAQAIVDGTIEQGPFNVAVASWFNRVTDGIEAETRIILIGDSDFVSNPYILSNANQNFFLNCVGWLSRETKLVTIRNMVLADQSIELNESEKKSMYWILSIIPILLLLAGSVVAWRRRGR